MFILKEIEELLAIMRSLRDKDTGCPWDLQQTHSSLAPYILEEAYEVEAAIAEASPKALCDELGDLLFQIVFHAQLAQEQKEFEFSDVVVAISDKMRRRHPHVFNSLVESDVGTISSLQQHSGDWESLKREERASQNGLGTLDGIAGTLPAVTRSMKLQNRAASVGFDWKSITPVFDKVLEELEEVRVEVLAENQDLIEDEIGDLFFAAVNLARHADVDPESALRRANRKFENRFRDVERSVLAQNLTLATMTESELMAVWEQVKRDEIPQ